MDPSALFHADSADWASSHHHLLWWAIKSFFIFSGQFDCKKVVVSQSVRSMTNSFPSWSERVCSLRGYMYLSQSFDLVRTWVGLWYNRKWTININKEPIIQATSICGVTSTSRCPVCPMEHIFASSVWEDSDRRFVSWIPSLNNNVGLDVHEWFLK